MKEKTKVFWKSSIIRLFLLLSFFLLLADFIIVCLVALSSGFSNNLELHGFYQFNPDATNHWSSLSGVGIFAVIWTIASFIISILIIVLYKKKADFQIGKHNRITAPFLPFWIGILFMFVLALLDQPHLFHITTGMQNNQEWFSLLYTTPKASDLNINWSDPDSIVKNLSALNYSVAGIVYIVIAIILIISYLVHFIVFMFRVIFSKNYTVAQRVGRQDGQRFN